MATGLSVVTTLTIDGDQDLFRRAAERLRAPRELMREVGLLGLAVGAERLTKTLKNAAEDAARTGALMRSLRIGGQGSVFDLSEWQVEVGSNLTYAAQRQYGGPIFPKPGHKALAIPLLGALKRSKQWPRDVDPDRNLLHFVPVNRGNVIGLLVDPGDEAERTDKRGRKRTRVVKRTPYGPGALFMLVREVHQEGTPYLFWSEDDVRVINEELVPRWLLG